ncbi:MAG: hypothetical protein ACREBW_06645, partial [Candidatus Micrarchaeaceae archaeon]
ALTQRYVNFFRSNLADLSGTMEVADVAILRSFASIQFNPAQSNFATVLFEQTLIQSKASFGIIFDRQVRGLERFKVLVLADQDALSDEQIERIDSFVQAGGGLVATGNTSLLTEWRRRRSSFGLARLFGISQPLPKDAQNIPIKRHFGHGRVIYVPRVEPDVPAPPATMTYSVHNTLWKLPKNYEMLVSAVRWAAGDDLSLEVEAPVWVTVELVDQESSRSRLLHLVNFRFNDPVTNIHARVKLPNGLRLREALLRRPEMSHPQVLEASVNRTAISIVIPRLEAYALVVLRTEPL